MILRILEDRFLENRLFRCKNDVRPFFWSIFGRSDQDPILTLTIKAWMKFQLPRSNWFELRNQRWISFIFWYSLWSLVLKVLQDTESHHKWNIEQWNTLLKLLKITTISENLQAAIWSNSNSNSSEDNSVINSMICSSCEFLTSCENDVFECKRFF